MSSTPQTLTFPNYTPERFARLEALLAAKGLKLNGDHGEADKFGADVDYDETGNVLTLTVLSAPHWPAPYHSMESFCGWLKYEINAVE